jgi:hypothetical protein
MLKKSLIKKSLIFGTIVLFLAALIAITGCTQATDSESASSGGGNRWNSLYGKMTVFQVQEAIDKAVALGVPVHLQDGLTIETLSGVEGLLPSINFKNATVVIEGKVDVSGVYVINAATASVQSPGGGYLQFGSALVVGTDFPLYIVNRGQDPSGYTRGAKTLIDYVSNVADPTATSQWIAVRDYTLGPKTGHDYTNPNNPIPVRDGVSGVIVLNKLTIPVEGAAAGGLVGFGALGTVDLIGTPGEKELFETNNKVILGTSATITSSKGYVELTLPAGTTGEAPRGLPAVKVEAGKPLVIKGAGNVGLYINKVEGPGVLTIDSASLPLVQVVGGDGNITFEKPITITTVDNFYVHSAGTTIFKDNVSILGSDDYPPTIAGDAVFSRKGTTALPYAVGDAVFGGNITLQHGVTLDITEATFSGGTTVKLGGDSYSADGAIQAVEIVDVLKFPAKTVLKGTAGTAEFTTPLLTKYAEKDLATARKITVAEPFTIDEGTLEVAATTFDVDNDITLTATTTKKGFLTIADGAAINLADTKTIAIGDGITIVGAGANGSAITPAGGSVTLGKSKIEGTEGALLTGTAGTLITVPSAKTLELKTINLNLVTTGLNLLTSDSSVSLLGSKIILETSAGVLNTRRKIANATTGPTNQGAISGIGAEVLAKNEKLGAAISSLADNGINPIIVKGNVLIKKGGSVLLID